MKTIEEIEKYAKENYVPIARKDLITFLTKTMTDNHYTSFLEIGSAIGYTAISMALLDDVYVTTIEHDEKRYNICQENIRDFGLESKIISIFDDALEIFLSLKYDVIFIDAAKAKNIAFFEKYKDNLKENGLIVIDNLFLNDFKKAVNPKKAKFYDEKILELKEFLNGLSDYEVNYYPIGDGIATVKHK